MPEDIEEHNSSHRIRDHCEDGKAGVVGEGLKFNCF